MSNCVLIAVISFVAGAFAGAIAWAIYSGKATAALKAELAKLQAKV